MKVITTIILVLQHFLLYNIKICKRHFQTFKCGPQVIGFLENFLRHREFLLRLKTADVVSIISFRDTIDAPVVDTVVSICVVTHGSPLRGLCRRRTGES